MSKNKGRIATAIAQIEETGDSTFTTYDGCAVVIQDAEPSRLPGVLIKSTYIDQREARQIAKFFKAFADSLERRYPSEASTR
jgi:hydroxymethylpyrimidine pyrophosphatase-like HAD family hydrolase